MQKGDEDSQSIILAGRALLVKMLITLLYNVFQHCQATDMQNGDEASPGIILAGRALLMKMFITLELRCIYFVQILYTIVF